MRPLVSRYVTRCATDHKILFRDKVKQRLESTSLESEIFKVTETDFERIKNENRKIERFGDSTESIYNEKNALEQIIIDKSKEMGAQFVIDASTVDKVAADAMTNLVLGFGRELNLTAGFSQKMENDVTILVRLVKDRVFSQNKPPIP